MGVARKSVWVVDDDADLRELVRLALEGAGFSVRTFANGAVAWTELSTGSEPPSALVLDNDMPLMTGTELRARQLEVPALAAIPAVIFTAGAPAVSAGSVVVPKTRGVEPLIAILRAACR